MTWTGVRTFLWGSAVVLLDALIHAPARVLHRGRTR